MTPFCVSTEMSIAAKEMKDAAKAIAAAFLKTQFE